MHGLAHLVVATEAERQVTHAATGLGPRQVLLDPCHSLDKVHTIVLVLLQSCAHRQDVHVEDDVLRWEADARQQVVGTLGNGNLAFEGCGLTLLVEGHHHHGGSQSAQFPGLTDKALFAVLQADRVDDALTLRVLQSSQNGVPIARVDHQY